MVSMNAVLFVAIVLFAVLSLVALGSGLVLKSALNNADQSHYYSLNSAIKKTFITSLIMVLLLVYYYLSTTV